MLATELLLFGKVFETMAACSEVMVYRELTIIIKVQSDQLHFFTIVIFDNCCIAYISFALQFPQSRVLAHKSNC